MTTAPTPLPRHTPHPIVLGFLGAMLAAAIVVGIVLLVRGNGTSSPATLRGSGTQAVQGRVIPRFHAVDLTGANNVVVYVGGPQTVSVRADSNLIKYVTTRVRGGTLAIGQSRSFTTNSPMSVEVSVPSLDAISLSGTGVLEVAGVKAAHLVVRLAGTGTLTVTGRTNVLDASIAGAGEVRLRGLVARDATATVAGAGRLVVNATHALDATVDGVGAIVYSGNPPELTVHTAGTGSISRG